jgi:hypothetical protein
MTRTNRRKLWHLAPRKQVLLDDAQGTMLRVARGTLWITLERDTRDIIVSTGEAFTIDRPGRTIVEAQDSSTVWVETRSRVRALAYGIARRIVHWARAAANAAERRRIASSY